MAPKLGERIGIKDEPAHDKCGEKHGHQRWKYPPDTPLVKLEQAMTALPEVDEQDRRDQVA